MYFLFGERKKIVKEENNFLIFLKICQQSNIALIKKNFKINCRFVDASLYLIH